MSEQAIAATMLFVLIGTMAWVAYRVETMLRDRIVPLHQAHERAADLAAAKQARIERALEQVTPGANATVQRIARILKGDA